MAATLATVADPVHLPSRARHDPRVPGRLPVPRRAAAGSSTSARPRACAAGSTPTSPTSRAAPAHPADGHHRGQRRVDRRSAPRSRRSSWSTPGSRSTTRGSTSATATTSATRSSRSRSTRSIPRLQVMRGPKRKGVRYFGPYSHAWAIRETLDLLLRVFPARTCSTGVFKRAGQSAGRACSATSASAPRRASAGSAPTSTAQIVEDFCDFMAGQTDTILARLEQRDAARRPTSRSYERAARLRDDIAPSPRDGEAVGGARRRHRRRRRRLRRGPARGRGPGVLRARRPGPRPARLGRRQGRGPRPPATWSSTSARRSTATSSGERRRPARVAGAGAAGRRRGAHRLARRRARQPGGAAGAAARRQAAR